MIGLTNDNWADNEIQAFKLLFIQKMQEKLFLVTRIWSFPAFLVFISYDTEYLQGLVWQNNIF